MAGVQGHALAAAVCNAGGLGSIPAAMLSQEALEKELTQLTALTDKPYNVNFFCHTPPEPDPAREAQWQQTLQPYYTELGLSLAGIAPGPGRTPFSEQAADVVEAFKPAVMSFHFGLPPKTLLARVKSWGSRVLASATTVDEALWLQAHGADAIIAQGLEAGGHRGIFLNGDLSTQMGTMALLPQIVQAVQVPVIAAGGIADAAGVAAAMALGASAVQIGTAICAVRKPRHRPCTAQHFKAPSPPYSAHHPVHRATCTRHREPADARTRPFEPCSPGISIGHRGHCTFACRRQRALATPTFPHCGAGKTPHDAAICRQLNFTRALAKGLVR